MISLDYTVFYQAVFFLVLWFILNKLLFGPFLRLLEERERRTDGVKSETAALTEEGQRLRAQYEEGISRAQAAGNASKEALVQEGRQQRERLLSQAREEAVSTLERARAEVLAELQKERELVAREADAVAQEMAGKILGRRVG